MKRRQVIIAGCIIVALIIGSVFLWLYSQWKQSGNNLSTKTTKSTKQAENLKQPDAPAIKFVFMGDMLAHDSIVTQARSGNSYNFGPYFTQLTPLYKEADVIFCNPETLSAGQAFGISGYPNFNAPSEFANDLSKYARCNLINLATNHIGDRSQAAIDATITNWENQKPLAIAGANKSPEDQMKVSYFEVKGIKFSFLAFADYSNNKAVSSYGLNNYHNQSLLRSLVSEARANSDVVIVSMHWGTEDSTSVNDDQRQHAALLHELGVDIIVGTGPHVLQPVSKLQSPGKRDTLIWYSLGNMLSSQLQINQLTSGIAGLTVSRNHDTFIVKDLTFSPTFMSYDWSPADRAASRIETRTNLTLQPLSSAQGKPETMFGTPHTVEERRQFITQTLGSEVPIIIK